MLIITKVANLLFFTPEALVTPHLGCQCIVARTLKELGHKVLFVRCHGSLARCPSKDMVSANFDVGTPQMQQICNNCVHESIKFLNHFELECINLENFISDSDYSLINSLFDIARNDLKKLIHDGIEFGKICLRDFSLFTKVSDFEHMNEEHQIAWRHYIHGSLISYLAINRIIESRKITHLIRYNEYANNIAVALAGYKLKLPVVTISQASHLSVDRRLVVLMSELGPLTQRFQMYDWSNWSNLHLTSKQVSMVADDIIVRCRGKGSHVYSPEKSNESIQIIQELGLSYANNTIVAYTSSEDEEYASRILFDALKHPAKMINKPFSNQIEWLDQLVKHVTSKPNLQLIIRIHPRAGRNKRDQVESQHLHTLRKKFSNQIERVRILWPESKISSYNLAEISNLALTSWSSIGLELARLGIPVLTAWHDVCYPDDDFMPWGGETPQLYFEKLESLLNKPIETDTLTKAFRCYHQQNIMRAIDLSDIISKQDSDGLVKFKMPREAETIEQVVVKGEPLRNINLSRIIAQQSPLIATEEYNQLGHEILRIIHYFMTNEEQLANSTIEILLNPSDDLIYNQSISSDFRELPTLLVNTSSKSVLYLYKHERVAKYSPLITRLAIYYHSYHKKLK